MYPTQSVVVDIDIDNAIKYIASALGPDVKTSRSGNVVAFCITDPASGASMVGNITGIGGTGWCVGVLGTTSSSTRPPTPVPVPVPGPTPIPTVPGAPKGFTATVSAPGQVALLWEAADDNGSKIFNYMAVGKVQRSSGAVDAFKQGFTPSGSGLNKGTLVLPADATYADITLFAQNAIGEGIGVRATTTFSSGGGGGSRGIVPPSQTPYKVGLTPYATKGSAIKSIR